MPSRSRKPRVAFLGYAHDARGGIAQFGRRLAEVVEEQAEVRLIGYRKLYPGFTRPGRQAPDPSGRAAGVTGPAITVPWSPRTWTATTDEIEAFAADLLVVQWWSPLFGPSVRSIVRRARRKGTRSLLVCHNDRPHEAFPLWRPITRAALSQADALAAFTQPVADGVNEIVPGRDVHVRPLPQTLIAQGEAADPGSASRTDPNSQPVILFFGNVRAYKGLGDLLEALPLVRQQIDATLVVAGTFFEPLERYERQARALGVEGQVRFIPEYVPDEQVSALFAGSDLVALPYRSATGSAVLGQAAMAGRPVVATSVGSLPDMLDGRGVLVPPRDPVRLAEGIVDALRHPPPPPPVDEGAWDRWRDFVIANVEPRSSPAYVTA